MGLLIVWQQTNCSEPESESGEQAKVLCTNGSLKVNVSINDVYSIHMRLSDVKLSLLWSLTVAKNNYE